MKLVMVMFYIKLSGVPIKNVGLFDVFERTSEATASPERDRSQSYA